MNDLLTSIKIGQGEVAHRVITESLREKILNGDFSPGLELPSTKDLANQWNTSKATVHTALKNLVIEGLLERRHGSGTYVRERPGKLETIGIYLHTSEIWTKEEMRLHRTLQGLVEKRLSDHGIAVRVFVDRRPTIAQREAMPELQNAVRRQEIQGLIVLLVNAINQPALVKLSVPSAFISSATGLPNRVSFLNSKLFAEALQQLVMSGCQSVGLISSVHFDPRSAILSESMFFLEDFKLEVKKLGLHTRPEWICLPDEYSRDPALLGYRCLHSVYKLKERPDALIVYPDIVVSGVITAALELGLHRQEGPVFFFHNNKGSGLLCPFPAYWAITDTDMAAEALIDLVFRQYRGEKIEPVHLPFVYKNLPSTIADTSAF